MSETGLKVRVREGKRLEHSGKEYGGGAIVDVGPDPERVKWLEEQGTADPVNNEPKSRKRGNDEEASNG